MYERERRTQLPLHTQSHVFIVDFVSCFTENQLQPQANAEEEKITAGSGGT